MSVMSVVARELIAAGLSGDALIAALERIERDLVVSAPPAVKDSRRLANARHYQNRKARSKSGPETTGARPTESLLNPTESRLNPAEPAPTELRPELRLLRPESTESLLNVAESGPSAPAADPTELRLLRPELRLLRPESTESDLNPPRARIYKNSLSLSLMDIESDSKKERTKRDSGARLRADWRPSEADRAYAASKGYSAKQINSIAEYFSDYWIAKAGASAVKRDWSAAWRMWIRNDRTTPEGDKLSMVY